jgi:hypothetical protein
MQWGILASKVNGWHSSATITMVNDLIHNYKIKLNDTKVRYVKNSITVEDEF